MYYELTNEKYMGFNMDLIICKTGVNVVNNKTVNLMTTNINCQNKIYY